MPIEKILLTDCLANLCILLCVQLGLGCFCPRNLFFATAILSLDTAAAVISGCSRLRAFPAQAVFCLAAASAVCGSIRLRKIAAAGICIICATCFCAGLVTLSRRSAPVMFLAALSIFFIIIRKRMNIPNRWNIEIYVEKCGVHDVFTALIDTGNRLIDHFSGQPVLIVESAAIPHICRILPEIKLHCVSFGVLGGSGESDCFKPDRVLIRGSEGEYPAPECSVAVYTGRIPGHVHALAPSEFADYAFNGLTRFNSVSKERGRINHAVFNCKTIDLRSGRTDQKGFRLLHRRQ